MEKVKINFDVYSDKKERFTFGDILVEVKPYLSTAEQIFLINKYIQDYFQEDELFPNMKWNCFRAELNLKIVLLQMSTNIDIDDINDNIYTHVEFWKNIFDRIENYKEFEALLYACIEDMKETIRIEKSIGTVLENLVSEGYSLLEKIPEMSPEEIEKLQKETANLAEKLESSSLIGDMNRGKAKEE